MWLLLSFERLIRIVINRPSATSGTEVWYTTTIMQKKILVLLGHPDKDTFSGSVADAYQSGAEEAGHEVKRYNVGDLDFDPILHKGYKEIQELEPDLVAVQDSIRWADHIVVVYPNWWCAMPAVLKGMFDRMWLPGFAFNFNKETKKIEKHLLGKTGRAIIISGTHSPLSAWWQFGDYTNEIQYGIMEFAGISTHVTAYGPCEKCADEKRVAWINDTKKLGKKAG